MDDNYSYNSDIKDGNDVDLDPTNPEHEFPILENEYNTNITKMETNPEASQFADCYTRLFDYAIKLKNNYDSTIDQLRAIESAIEEKDDKLENAFKLADLDSKTIEELRLQLNVSWRLTDQAHAREQAAQEIIENLRRQVEGLNSEIAQYTKIQDSEDSLQLEKTKDKDELERQKERLLNEILQLQSKLNNALGYQEELERKNSLADLKLNEIHGQLEDQVGENEKQKRIRERLEAELTAFKLQLDERNGQISDLNGVVATYTKQNHRLEMELKESKAANDKIARELEVTTMRQNKMLDDISSLTAELDETRASFQLKLTDLKIAENELSHLRMEVSKLTKAKESLDNRMLKLIEDKTVITNDREKLRLHIASLEKEVESCKKYADQTRRTVETASKEKEVLNKAILKQQSIAKEHDKLIKIQEHSKKKLEQELDNLFIESDKLKKVISGLEHDKDRLDDEQLNLKKKIETNVEEIKLKKAQIFDLKRTLTEQENKLRQQQNLFEAVRMDRNALQKALQESSAETGELKNKLKIVFHQTEQLKEDISMKEKLLIKEENVMRKITKEKENLKLEVDLGVEEIKKLRLELKEMKDEEKRLHKSLMDNERLIREQAKDLEQLMNERDVLGSQLVRRNDEISLLNEKILILQTTLNRGESQYEQRLDDIRLLKIEVKRLRQEKNIINRSMTNMLDFRQEIFRLERDLVKYRLKCRALEEEIQNPLNIHRWRKLEGSDPEVLELIQKVQTLQKRILQQAAEAVERERQLKEVQKLYDTLRQVVQQQPAPGIQEELVKTQKALKLKTDKLKCLVSELNMTELRAAQFKNDWQKVSDELCEMKRKFLEEKKALRSQKLQSNSSKEVNRTLQSSSTCPKLTTSATASNSAPAGGRATFTGGGFRMSVQQISTK